MTCRFETTVAQVVKELKSAYHIEETTFVGDRGMITPLHVQRIASEGQGLNKIFAGHKAKYRKFFRIQRLI
jgi:hypothetical protein